MSREAPKAEARPVNVAQWIDEHPVSALQIGVILLCGLGAVMDQFSLQAMSILTPVVAATWHLNPARMASVLSGGLLGMMVGSLVAGPVADAVGRKVVIVVSLFVAGILAYLTPLAHDIPGLLGFRVGTGLGVGALFPNLLALAAEYSPSRSRKAMVSMAVIGLVVGTALPALVSYLWVAKLGWGFVFRAGGIATLIVGLAMLVFVPESIRFLVAKGSPRRASVAVTLNRMSGRAVFSSEETFVMPEAGRGYTVARLFAEGQAANTVLLWIVAFMNLLLMYFLVGWMTTLLARAGLPITRAILGTLVMSIGGIVAGVLMAFFADRWNLRFVLAAGYFLGGVSLAVTGHLASAALLMAMLFFGGFFVIGTQYGVNALAASIYPTVVRATGASWALGVGRAGAVIGPLIGGMLIAQGLPLPTILLVGGIPALIAAVSMVFLRTQGIRAD